MTVSVQIVDVASGRTVVASKATTTNAKGYWSIQFEPLGAITKAEVVLQARTPGGGAVLHDALLENVAVGQIWLCAGAGMLRPMLVSMPMLMPMPTAVTVALSLPK